MSTDRDALHESAEARQVVGMGAQVGAAVAEAIARIRAAARSANQHMPGNWYAGDDLCSLLPEPDRLLLLACDPESLALVLDAAERAIRTESRTH